jgi:hypothetical protein
MLVPSRKHLLVGVLCLFGIHGPKVLQNLSIPILEDRRKRTCERIGSNRDLYRIKAVKSADEHGLVSTYKAINGGSLKEIISFGFCAEITGDH